MNQYLPGWAVPGGRILEGTRAKKSNGSRQTAKPVEALKFDFKSFLSSIGPGRSSQTYKARKVVFQQGDPADAVFYIESGKIELSVVSAQGKQGVIAILGRVDKVSGPQAQ